MENATQRMGTVEYYIGLRKDSKSREWKWISDNGKVSATTGKFPVVMGIVRSCMETTRNAMRDCLMICLVSYFITDIFVRVPLRALTKRVCFINYYALYCDFTGHFFPFQIAPYKLLLKVKLFWTH